METISDRGNWEKVSPSRLGALDDCPRKLWWKYDQKIPEGPAYYASRGTVLEAMVMSIIRNERSDFSTHSVEAEGRRAWGEECDKNPGLEDFNEKFEKELPRMLAGAETYQHSGELVADQFYCEVQFKRLPKIHGFGDLLIRDMDGSLTIRDIKCKGQLSNSVLLSWRRQLTVYALSVMIKHQLEKLPKTEIDMVSVGKTPGHRRIPVHLSGDDISELINQLEKLVYHIDNGFWPQNRVSKYCSEENCSYYSRCIYGDSFVSYNNAMELLDEMSVLRQ